MALNYKGTVIHDGGCRCCVVDASPPRLGDPTGTAQIRRAMRTDLRMHWQAMRGSLRMMILDRDMLGLRQNTVTSSMIALQSTTQGATKLQIFQSWFDNELQRVVLGGDGRWLGQQIELAYDKGVAFGNSSLQSNWMPQQGPDQKAMITQLAIIELQGIMEAVSQQTLRAVAENIALHKTPSQVMRAAFNVINKIGITRSNAMANLLIVRAFTDGTLDALELGGVKQVGIIPEHRYPQPQQIADAMMDAKMSKAAGTKRRERERKKRAAAKKAAAKKAKQAKARAAKRKLPTKKEIEAAIRAEERMARLKLVNVRTAGDDDVCPVCEEIAEDGPYAINTARSLIPAHPNCRCAFVPARARRKKTK